MSVDKEKLSNTFHLNTVVDWSLCERIINDQGQAGWGAEKPDRIEDVPAHLQGRVD